MPIFDFLLSNSKQRSKGDIIPKSQNLFFSKGDRAIVSKTIEPNHLGRIYYQGTYWFGYGLNNGLIPEGTVVNVLARQGTTWLVEPYPVN